MTRELGIAAQQRYRQTSFSALGPDATFARRCWYDSAKVVVRLGLVLAFRIRYSGLDNIPSDGGLLVVSNHQSHLDPPLVGAGFPRRMNYLARDTLFRFAPFAWLIRSFNAIPIDREGGGLSGMKQTLRRLKRGETVLVFPEGTRTHNGEIAPFRAGLATLAIRGNAAIVPTTIEGAFDVWPRQRNYPLPSTIHVHFSRAVLASQLAEFSEQALVREVELRVRQGQAMIRRRPVFARRHIGPAHQEICRNRSPSLTTGAV
jgi:1-acyl-sn-glycerol-3-phosphate acyltransferase